MSEDSDEERAEERRRELASRFEEARALGRRVCVAYRAQVPDDPALPAELTRNGLMTVVEGHPLRCDQAELCIEPVAAEGETPPKIEQKIPWAQVVDLKPTTNAGQTVLR